MTPPRGGNTTPIQRRISTTVHSASGESSVTILYMFSPHPIIIANVIVNWINRMIVNCFAAVWCLRIWNCLIVCIWNIHCTGLYLDCQPVSHSVSSWMPITIPSLTLMRHLDLMWFGLLSLGVESSTMSPKLMALTIVRSRASSGVKMWLLARNS